MKAYLYEVFNRDYQGKNVNNLIRKSVLIYANDVFDAQEKLKKNYPCCDNSNIYEEEFFIL